MSFGKRLKQNKKNTRDENWQWNQLNSEMHRSNIWIKGLDLMELKCADKTTENQIILVRNIVKRM